jgi:hypothetical protein
MVTGVSMAANEAGEGLALCAVYDQGSTIPYSLTAQRYLPGFGWAPLGDLSGAVYPIYGPEVAADSHGNFFATYTMGRTSTWDYLTVVRYNDSAGWSGSLGLQYMEGYTVAGSVLLVSPDGNAIVVWEKQNTVNSHIQVLSRSYTPGSGWSSEMTVREYGAASVYYLTAGIGAGGSAAVAWAEYTGSAMVLKCARYTPGYQWTVIETLAPSSVSDIGAVEFVGGAPMVIWLQYGSPQPIMCRAFSGSAWGPAVQIASDEEPMNLELAANSGGSAMLVWGNRSWGAGVRFATYASGAWSAPAPAFAFAKADECLGHSGLHLAEGGRAVLAYNTIYAIGNADRGIFSRAYAPATGWSGAAQVSAPSAYNGETRFSISGNGFILAHWTTGITYERAAMAAWYVPYDLPGPNLMVTSPANGTASATPYILVSGTTDPGAMVYVNGLKAAVDASGGFAAQVPLAGGSNTLMVTAEGQFGNTASAQRTVSYTDPSIQGMQNDINDLKGQGTLSVALALMASVVAAVAVVMLFLRKRP